MKCRRRVRALPPIRNGGLAFLENPFQQGVVVVFNMSRLVWRADAHHGTHRIDQMRCSYDRRTAEGVADE
jgi:hypothetical protein